MVEVKVLVGQGEMMKEGRKEGRKELSDVNTMLRPADPHTTFNLQTKIKT
jgi:hypothetical protein